MSSQQASPWLLRLFPPQLFRRISHSTAPTWAAVRPGKGTAGGRERVVLVLCPLLHPPRSSNAPGAFAESRAPSDYRVTALVPRRVAVPAIHQEGHVRVLAFRLPHHIPNSVVHKKRPPDGHCLPVGMAVVSRPPAHTLIVLRHPPRANDAAPDGERGRVAEVEEAQTGQKRGESPCPEYKAGPPFQRRSSRGCGHITRMQRSARRAATEEAGSNAEKLFVAI